MVVFQPKTEPEPIFHPLERQKKLDPPPVGHISSSPLMQITKIQGTHSKKCSVKSRYRTELKHKNEEAKIILSHIRFSNHDCSSIMIEKTKDFSLT